MAEGQLNLRLSLPNIDVGKSLASECAQSQTNKKKQKKIKKKNRRLRPLPLSRHKEPKAMCLSQRSLHPRLGLECLAVGPAAVV